MRWDGTNILNAACVAGVLGMVFAASGMQNPGVDPVTTASVPAVRPMLGDRFIAINHLNNTSCVIALHRSEGYAVHRVEPAQNCGAVGDEFMTARAWQETKRGEVTVTNARGETLMKLTRSDGFEWDVIKPARIQASLAAY